jgi:16S rRNA processing protein RimM
MDARVKRQARPASCSPSSPAAHGIRGEVRLKSFAEDASALTDYGPLERSDGGAPLEVVSLRPAKDGLIARFAGVSDRNAADALKGVELSVPRERLPEPEPDEFYFADLVGLAAVRPDGTALGEVIAVHNFGAGDVIEVRACRRPRDHPRALHPRSRAGSRRRGPPPRRRPAGRAVG